MDIYFQVKGHGNHYSGGYQIMYNVYLLPKQKYLTGTGVQYSLFGEKEYFKWVNPSVSISIPESELPKEFVYSFKHGLDNISLLCEYEDTIGSFDRKPTKEQILKAISQTHMYTKKEVTDGKKMWRGILQKEAV